MLIDSAEVTIKAGKGGDGVVSWRREKFVPMGGPDGGDGGRGASIVFRSNHNLDTLSSYRYRKVFQAENGQNGMSKKMSGHAGEDLELLVPVGTLVTDTTTGQVLADFTETDRTIKLVRGGKGGLGNVHFTSSTHQAPTEFTTGQPGEMKTIRLELQLIADVALLGLPNAGKSSIISALTGVEARIGAYAFSTTEPILGVMRRGDQTITLVDLPGLIEGASSGKGLGDRFLQHTKRVRAIVFVVDGTDPKPKDSLQTVAKELEKFEPDLAHKPSLMVINKIDLLSAVEQKKLKNDFPDAVFVSAAEKTNLKALEDRLIALVS